MIYYKKKDIYGISIRTRNDGRYWVMADGTPLVFDTVEEAAALINSSRPILKKLFPEAVDFFVRGIDSDTN